MQSCTCKGNKKKWFYGIEICLFSCFSESVVEGGGKGSGMVGFCVFMCWLLWGYVLVVVCLGVGCRVFGWRFGCMVIAVGVSGSCDGNIGLPRRRLDGVIKQ